ncbi:MAG: S8 family peptidase [Steroidobacteraceae bacterium]
MNTPRSLLAICLLSVLPMAASAAESASADRVIVKWRNADTAFAPVSASRLRTLSARVGQSLTRGRNIGGDMSVVYVDRTRTGASLAATLAALRADADVELAVPDTRVKIQAYTPSDPLFAGSQWYLQSIELAATRADAAWDITKGGATSDTSSVVIAVIDTGVRRDHPDLVGKLLPGYDFVSLPAVANDGDGWDPDPSDPGDFLTPADLASDAFKDGDCGSRPASSWHGTRVTGLIAANTDNGVGIAGAAFNVRVLPVRVLGKCGGFTSDVIAGMYWAAGLVPPPPLLQSTDLPVNAHPAQILNMSLGSEGACTSSSSAPYRAAVKDILEHGVLIVASAGNEGAAVGTPASCDGVLAVSGIRHAGTKVGYSNLGPEVGIAAPAGNCVNGLAGEPCIYALNTTTNAGQDAPTANIYSTPLIQPTYGTSFSSPLVAGAAGLMKAVNPGLTPTLLIARIKETARAFPTTSAGATVQPPACLPVPTGGAQAFECICNTQVCGAGMLNAEAAVIAARRPAVLAQVIGIPGPGRTLTLDGSASAAAAGRTIASYAWTVVSATGGAVTPVLQMPGQAVATLTTPSQGTVMLQLTVTDNLGSSDSATVTIDGVGGITTTSPPSVPASSGGGGSAGLLWLVLLAVQVVAVQRQRFVHVFRH